MRTDIFEHSSGAASFGHAEAIFYEHDAVEGSSSVKADVPWWEADLSGLVNSDTSDVSMWQDAQVEAWARAV